MEEAKPVYEDIFDSWEDVQREFRTDYPEPEKVIFARYTYEDYSGAATVVFKNEGAFFVVSGSHCSCYGLEDQFDPEEYETADLLIAAIEKGSAWVCSEFDRGGVIERIRAA